jgi:hypothetical protein
MYLALLPNLVPGATPEHDVLVFSARPSMIYRNP